MSRYELFDRNRVRLRPISERGHDLTIENILHLQSPDAPVCEPEFQSLVQLIRSARSDSRPVIVMMGAHPIKLGLSRYLIDLIDRGFVTHVAMNGAGVIHDFELAAVGGTSENVAKWISLGQFGLWKETSAMNEILQDAARRREGFGEAVGRTLQAESFPHSDVSICAAGWRNAIPVSTHVLFGGDIIHAMPNANGEALGKVCDVDFLMFAHSISQLSEGVFLNFGSAVTGPEVFLKALSMARNMSLQQGRTIGNFTTAVIDLMPLPADYRVGPPEKNTPQYYYRPWKTLLCRTVQDTGQSFYFRLDHRVAIPNLWHFLVNAP